MIERRVAERGNAVVYALTAWGAELREPIEGLIRWSTPLMVRAPPESTVGIAVENQLLQVRTARTASR